MGVDLYGIRVLEISPAERRVRLRVFVLDYDVASETNVKSTIPVSRTTG